MKSTNVTTMFLNVLFLLAILTSSISVSSGQAQGNAIDSDSSSNNLNKDKSLTNQAHVDNKTSSINQINYENPNITSSDNSTENTGSLFENLQKIYENREMLMRTFYVLLGVTSIVVVYFVIKAVRMRHRKSKARRYGLLAGRGDKLEMTPLDQEEEEEDETTLYEMNGRKR